jgi:hypothetical protein
VGKRRGVSFETLGWIKRGVLIEEILERLSLVKLESAISRLRK